MPRTLLAILALSFSCTLLQAADRSPDPVDPAILEAPGAEHIPTLMAALNGSGCRPEHSEVGNALVQIGEPAVAPLVERLNGTTKWWIQLECVHLLGLMGVVGEVAEADLARFLDEEPHLVPLTYGRASLAAVRGDPLALFELVESGRSNVVPFALELLERMGPDAAPVIPTLREYALNVIGSRQTQVEAFLENYDATIAAVSD